MNSVLHTLSASLLATPVLATLALGGCTRAAAQPSQGDVANSGPPIACKLDALNPAERERQSALLRELGTMTKETRETGDGYALRLPADTEGFQKVAEWITLERRCCPFLNFELKWKAGEETPWLELGGRKGVKAFLAAEMGGGT
jgi:hypothetical protein